MSINKDEIITATDINNGVVQFVKTTGAANNYNINFQGINNYYEGLRFCIKPHITNTGASIINVNNLGNKSIKDTTGKELQGNTLLKNNLYQIGYNGEFFILLDSGSGRMIPNNGIKIITPGVNNVPLTGYYEEGSYVKGDSNLIPENIKKDKEIFNVTGKLNNGGVISLLDLIRNNIYYYHNFNSNEYQVYRYGDRYKDTNPGITDKEIYFDSHKVIIRTQWEYGRYYDPGYGSLYGFIASKQKFIFPKSLQIVYFKSYGYTTSGNNGHGGSNVNYSEYMFFPNNDKDDYLYGNKVQTGNLFELNSCETKWMTIDSGSGHGLGPWDNLALKGYANHLRDASWNFIFDNSIPD